jgi:hypothetical protein
MVLYTEIWQEVGEKCIMRRFITCTLLQVQLEWEDEMGRECSTNGGEEECI